MPKEHTTLGKKNQLLICFLVYTALGNGISWHLEIHLHFLQVGSFWQTKSIQAGLCPIIV